MQGMAKQKRTFKSDKLFDLRTEAGLTQEELGRAIGKDGSAVSKWEVGFRPGPRSLRALARHFKVPIATFFMVAALVMAAPAARADVSVFDAVQAIVGEAANQPFVGMIAVGEVIQNRDSVGGMYGFKAPHVKHEKLATWIKAWAAYFLSTFTNFTRGATLFENIYAFGVPVSWDREKIICVAHIGDHWFFEETDLK
jgi:transcriptional regulator with XRE-family HTH domain